jgi:ribosomal protein S18 acetylase RimI-like enzyme
MQPKRRVKLGQPVIRRYEKRDEKIVLSLTEEYASWNATLTAADLQGFHASEPDLFLVAEISDAVVGFVYGRESRNVPDEVLRRWAATKVGSVEVLAVEEHHRRKGAAQIAPESSIRSFQRKRN